MGERLIDFDPETGEYVTYVEDGDGFVGQRFYQDVSKILDLNLEAANHCNPNNPEGDVRMVARIPNIVKMIWKNEYGIDADSRDPDMQRKVDQLLNSNEWLKLRTDRSAL